MNNKKRILCAVIPFLTASLLVACNRNKPQEESSEPKPLEIGDTVKEWTSSKNSDQLPLGMANANSQGEIVNNFGNNDKSSLKYEVVYKAKEAYLGSDLLETPYFTEDDAKNGDIISLYAYVPGDGNVSSLQMEVFPISMNNSIKSNLVTFTEDNLDTWVRLMVSFDTLETLGAIRLNYKVVDEGYTALFYIDDINITLGEETVKTDYAYNDESLYKTYENYFKVGTCMSAQMLANTEYRRITKDNFNSITAENEGKPERILDQEACQELAKTDETQVAITTKPFEKLYSWCEANHIKVRHHTLVWFDQTPQWFFRKNYTQNGALLSKEKMLQRMENFIKVVFETINTRWPGLVYAVDVANEAVQNGAVRKKDNNNMNPNYWYETVGADFVYYAFKFSRMYAAEGQALYYNDYAYDYETSNCRFAVNTLLKQAIEEGLIDGVGIQTHLSTDANVDNIITDAKMIHQKGLACQLTEIDVTTNGNSKTIFNTQGTYYKSLVTKVLKANAANQTNIDALVLWGITDNASWRRNQYPLLFNDNYAKKPAYYGFLEAIQSVQPQEPAEGEAR